MNKDQPNKQENLNNILGHDREHEGTRKSFKTKEDTAFYPHLPSYSEVPSTYPSYLQHNNTIAGNEPYVPPWHNGTGMQDIGVSQRSRFGLIRGYHQQMYEPSQTSVRCCSDCTSPLRSKPGSNDPKCNGGMICGLLLIMLGVFALIMGFSLPQKMYSNTEIQKLTSEEKNQIENTDFYIAIFILSGLSVLSLGGIVFAIGILYPVCRRGRDEHDDSNFNRYYGSEVYVKEEQAAPRGKEGGQKMLVNFGFHRDVVPTDMTLRKVQPESMQTEPIEVTRKLFK